MAHDDHLSLAAAGLKIHRRVLAQWNTAVMLWPLDPVCYMLHALDFVTSTFDGNIPALLYMCYAERCGEENLRHHSVLTEVFTLLSLSNLLHIQTATSPYGPPM